MSVIVPGGNPAASVTGLILQELDPAKNVVFQWSSWDHFAITDATHQNLTGAVIDYVHANAFEWDTDGHILLSSRHMDEITKINRQTGEIIWRLGGRNNQFTFLNDTLRFSHQHDVRRLPNGNITLFDNGNFHVPQFSRVVEYRLDETLMTAELVWEYRHTPDIYAFATGNAQRLPNGNTLISWGTTNRIMEVRPDGSKALDIILSSDFRTYRAHRFPWSTVPVAESAGLPAAARLLPAYPNPFNAGTRISYDVPVGGQVLLTLSDILGRRVAVLLDGYVGAGTGSVMLEAGDLTSGVYFVRLAAGGSVDVRKMILLR